MKKQNDFERGSALLRQKAEERLKMTQANINQFLTEADNLKLIHELQVHQIELEMQYEELLFAKEKAELAEEKYLELYDFAPSGYITLSINGKITELNFAAANLLGTNRSQLINRNFDQFTAPESRAAFKFFFNNVYKFNENQSCEIILVREDLSRLDILLDGKVRQKDKQCLITLIDISEKKKVDLLRRKNQELIFLNERTEESDRLKSAFLANMSHEIRTPLNGILGFAELLKEPHLNDKKQQKYIRIIEKSGVRMLNIINDIIDISKIEAGLMQVDKRSINVNEKIEFINKFFQLEVEEKKLKLVCHCGLPKKEANIITDDEKFFSILSNLVKNAIKYCNKGTIELGYTKKGNFLEFYVKDFGIGIPLERQDAIFRRFIQVEVIDNMARQGAGLGLAIAKNYVEMLGGQIWVESEEGIGSQFYFTLPYHSVLEESEDSGTVVFDDHIEITASEIKKLKILIAEDDEMSEMFISLSVNNISREILKAKTGRETIQLSIDNPDIDLILLDIQMPEISGYEAARQIRQFNKDVVIIAQTAYGLQGDREKAIEAGCDDYIAKPIKKDQLIALIHKYFQK